MKKNSIRRVALRTVAVLAGGAAILTAVRWRTWFHNPPEAPYRVAAVPSRLLLTFGSPDGSDRMVSWMCDTSLQPSYVEIRDAADSAGAVRRIGATGEVFESRSGKAAYYRATLDSLNPGHRYIYRVAAQRGGASAWHSFAVPRYDEPSGFIFVGDVQDSIGGIAGSLLREAFAREKAARFLVSGGDLAERPTDAFWAEAFRSLDSVAAAVPVLTATGNHEYLKGPVQRLERRFTLVNPYYLGTKIADNHVYSVRQGDAEIFVLDSNRELPYLHTQAAWLEDALAASGARWKIVVLHHPLHSLKGKSNNIVQRFMFDSVIRRAGVDLVLQGHEHAYARRTVAGEDGERTTPVYTVSHMSPKTYRIRFSDDFDRYALGSRYYQTVVLRGDTMTVTARDAFTAEAVDSFAIIKHGSGAFVDDRSAGLPERIDYRANPSSEKDRRFVRRIEEYKQSSKFKK